MHVPFPLIPVIPPNENEKEILFEKIFSNISFFPVFQKIYMIYNIFNRLNRLNLLINHIGNNEDDNFVDANEDAVWLD
tara:strand:- start:601 stop:834 length:234 start_codon:yes stop_codon:yes gene_type:complete